jgi:hypothetical protein
MSRFVSDNTLPYWVSPADNITTAAGSPDIAAISLHAVTSCRRSVNGEGPGAAGRLFLIFLNTRSAKSGGGRLSGIHMLLESRPGRFSNADMNGSNPLTPAIQGHDSRRKMKCVLVVAMLSVLYFSVISFSTLLLRSFVVHPAFRFVQTADLRSFPRFSPSACVSADERFKIRNSET